MLYSQRDNILNSLKKEEQLLLSACQLNSDEETLHKIEVLTAGITDWKYFMERAVGTYTAPLLHKNFSRLSNKNTIPASVLSTLKDNYNNTLAHNIRLYDDFKKVTSFFNQAAINFIPLKGIMLAEVVYKDIGLRHLSDIDILVRNKDVEKAKDIILSMGWSLMGNRNTTVHPYSFVKGNSVLELHDKIYSETQHVGRITFQMNIEDYWSRAVKVANGMCLNPSDLVQHLCIHLIKHFYFYELKITAFCDIKEVIKHYGEQIDWKLLRDSSIKYDCLTEIQKILFLCKKYWGANVSDVILEDNKRGVDKELEKTFLNFFRGNIREIAYNLSYKNIPSINRIYQVKGLNNKLKYLLHGIFPSRKYIISRYRVKFKWMIYLYYIKRIGIGLLKLIPILFTKMLNLLHSPTFHRKM